MASKVFEDILFAAGDARLASASFKVTPAANCTIAVNAPTTLMTLQILTGTVWVPVRSYDQVSAAIADVTFLNSAVTARAVLEPGEYRLSRTLADATAEAKRYYC